MANSAKWYGMRYPDSDLVGLLFRFARPPADGRCALDIGCGAGRHVRLLRELGYDARGIDHDPQMIEQAHANGVGAELADVADFRPPSPLELAVAWGMMMLLPHGPRLVAALSPRLIIADWRTENDSSRTWPDNRRNDDGSITVVRPGHALHGQHYYYHSLQQCQFPGYEQVHWQRVARQSAGETNEWFQTVHRARS